MDYSHFNPEDLDFVFRYINRHQNSDKSLEDILSKLTGDYPEFSGFITRLLEEQDDAEKWFAGLIENIDEAVASDDFFAPGDRLGPYRIVEQIERGGMSQIYLAERYDGEFEQKVAVKVMDAHFDNEMLAGFFRQEKTILARLNHPNVAQIFDGGFIASGHPYYIMEYVEGVPVDEYVTLHNLSLRQRLDIIVTICKAISFAHKNLIIHKDIKPQNIFVDSNGHIKLLDFGVAGSLSSSEQKSVGSDTLFVTKKYASPEMLRKEPVNISSDIYQLGLMAYKILTGLHPKDTGDDKILFPSDFKKHGDRGKAYLPSVGEIDGELEAILRKALKENPDERYDSVFGMQHEIENYIADKPVDTYSNTAAYLIAKFIKRNKALARTTGLFIAVIAAISIFYVTNLNREKNRAEKNAVLAREQTERSKATINYLKALIYKADPFSDGKHHSANLMDSMAMMAYRQLESDFTAQPKTKADIYVVLADIFRSRNRYQESFQALFEAQRLINMEEPSNDDQQARVWYNLATTYIHDGTHIDSAKYHIDKAIAIDSMNPDVSNNRLSYELETLGRIYAIEGKYDSAIRFYSQSLSRREQQKGRENEITKAGTMSMLGEIYMRQGHYDKAMGMLQESLQMHTKYLGEQNGYVVNDINKLANLYLKLNRYDTSINYLMKSIRLTKQIYGDSSSKLINSYSSLSNLYSETGKTDSTLYYGEQALNLAKQVFGANHIQTARRYNTLGLAYFGSGLVDEAIPLYNKALEIKRRHHPEARYSINITKYNLATALLEKGQTDEAIAMLIKVYAYERETYGDDNTTVAVTMRLLAQAYIDAGHTEKATTILEKAGPILESGYDEVHRRKAEYFITLAELHLHKGNLHKSLKLAERSKTIYKQLYGDNHWRVAFSMAFHSMIAKKLNIDHPEINEAYLRGMDALESRLPKHKYFYNKLVSRY